jgi:hypothetical protein
MVNFRISSAELGGSVYKTVSCVECGLDYVYLLSRRAQGGGFSVLNIDNDVAQLRAESRAARRWKGSWRPKSMSCPAPVAAECSRK